MNYRKPSTEVKIKVLTMIITRGTQWKTSIAEIKIKILATILMRRIKRKNAIVFTNGEHFYNTILNFKKSIKECTEIPVKI